MKCPRCGAPLKTQPDAAGFLLCPACGARLRARPAHPAPAPREPGPAPTAEPSPSPPAPGPTLETLLAEIRGVRQVQEEILGVLKSRGGPPASQTLDGDLAFGMLGEDQPEPAAAPPLRTRRRKTVLLLDDDDATRQAALEALTQAEVPTRAFADGNSAVSAIAAEKPDVIALELGLSGSMGGRDVVNVIKSTMEWVDIPIVLYTREPVTSQKEARQVHGADEVVAKGPQGPAALVQRVIAIFRRG